MSLFVGERRLNVGCFIVFLLIFFTESLAAQKADTSSIEWVKVFFNMPADHTVAKESNLANDEADLLQTLIDLIDSAKYSVDLAAYDLENLRVGEALTRAAERGVQVRVVTDYYNRFNDRELDEKMWEMLRNAGIYSIDDGGEVFHPDGSVTSNRLTGASYDMHNKFAVIDILSNNPEDYYVWTGSMNLTYTGPINTNNTILIKDSDIAEAYHEEFRQMWGGNREVPNPEKARYHKDKRYVGERVFFVDSTKVELYFAPINRDDTKPSPAERIHELIEKAQLDVNFLAFAITHDIPMSQEMWRRSFSDGIRLQGLIDPRFYAQYRNAGVIWATPESQLGTRNIRQANELRTLHSKIMLIDVTQPFENNRGIAITGSYNYSNNAEQNNDENLLIIHSPLIANQYYQDFMGAMNRSMGISSPPVPQIYTDEWYPVKDVIDGNLFEIELAEGFGYPVRLLGVDAPRIYVGQDSSEYYSGQAAVFLSNLLEDKEVRLEGYDAGVPESRYGSFRAYVQARDESGEVMNVNSEMIKKGFGEWTPYYRQQPDSIDTFQRLTRLAKSMRIGMWKAPDRIGEKIARVELGSDGEKRDVTFPININIADETTLQALTGIGPAYATRIVKYRFEHGLFSDIEELTNIRGIGPVTMQKLRPYVTIE
ncbi:MAG: phospholipase D-like domain-containing protein [Balneolaceae bacterium]|nr:phospholipase D-like domain-containing protein [Balneolaceae bacterium]